MKNYLSVYGEIEVVGDGDMLCARYSDFVNLQESLAGFGKIDSEAIANLAGECKRENARLHEIVDKLPKTADGVTVIPFVDDVFVSLGGIIERLKITAFEDNRGYIARTYRWDLDRNVPVCHCYATADNAANAATKEESHNT
jgi:hypothetical protein